MPRLRRVDCSDPGITRRRRGRGFEYVRIDGTQVRDRGTLDRIAGLGIPPAWKDVWICTEANGHIQATGIDDAGRKQYLYHDAWRTRRDQQKFDDMTEFATALKRLRRRIDADLDGTEPTRERVLAGAVRLLDLGFFRIGSERYAEENRSYGLATVRKKHVTLNGGSILFDYRAKGGKRHRRELADPELLPLVRQLKRRRGGGEELLAYKDDRRWRDVTSTDINGYIKAVTGGDYSAKDFRTWNATVLAAVALANEEEAKTTAARKRAVARAVKTVAGYLDNTPAVCRSSYIDPRVIDRYNSGTTIAPRLKRIVSGSDPTEFPDRGRIERAVLDLISSR
jgi:DNA topoisomerase IB